MKRKAGRPANPRYTVVIQISYELGAPDDQEAWQRANAIVERHHLRHLKELGNGQPSGHMLGLPFQTNVELVMIQEGAKNG